MPVGSRSSAASAGYATELIARNRSYGVAARSGFPGEMMPAPAQDDSRPKSWRSRSVTRAPSRANVYAVVRPITPPPMISTSAVDRPLGIPSLYSSAQGFHSPESAAVREVHGKMGGEPARTRGVPAKL